MGNKFLLTGEPKIGKTTAVKKIIDLCQGISFGGFYTEEVREEGVRTGFRLTSFNNKKVQIASTASKSDIRVGKYGVDVQKFEEEGLELLYDAQKNADVIVIDEIGPMQLYSQRFYESVQNIIGSDQTLLGTIVLRPYDGADQIKENNKIKLIELTNENRELVPHELAKLIQKLGSSGSSVLFK